jgi:hypothetical protein
MRSSIVASFICVALSVYAVATQAQTSKWAVDDIVMAEHVTGFEISPDSRFVGWVKSTADRFLMSQNSTMATDGGANGSKALTHA